MEIYILTKSMVKKPFLYFEFLPSRNQGESSSPIMARSQTVTSEKFLKHRFSIFHRFHLFCIKLVCWLLWGRPKFKVTSQQQNPWITGPFGNRLRCSLQSHPRRLMGGVRTQMSSLIGTRILLLGLIYYKEPKLIDGIQHTTNPILRRQSQNVLRILYQQ